MGIALLSAMRSKDPSTQVGACIVNQYNKIVGIGYNGFPIGCDDDKLPWDKTSDNANETKYPYVVHAEANAIISASRRDMIGADLYLVGEEYETRSLVENANSCAMCKRMILNAGIERVIIRDLNDVYRIIETKEWIENDDSLVEQLGY